MATVLVLRSRRGRTALAAATLACAAAAGLATAARVAVAHDGTAGFEAAARAAAVTVEGVLVDDPRVIPVAR